MSKDTKEYFSAIYHKVDPIIIDGLQNLPEPLANIEGHYMTLMPLLSSLVHKHCDILAECMYESDPVISKTEYFIALITEINKSCLSGYANLQNKTNLH